MSTATTHQGDQDCIRVSAAKTGLKDYLEHLKKETQGGIPQPYPLDNLFPITNEEWNKILTSDPKNSHRLYFTSYLLVYYFMHLDGKGDGQLFARYFQTRHGHAAANELLDLFDRVLDEVTPV